MINHGTVVFDDSVAALKQRFLKRKRIELKLFEPIAEVHLPGTTTIRHDDYELVVEIDTSQQPIEAAVAALMGGTRVADVRIEDPPLEEIIAAMYIGSAAR
jgi:ABC-2 type transport system ATP-binding protein